MPIGVSPVFTVVEGPFGNIGGIRTAGIVDDWTFSEGSPPSYASPLVSQNIHHWHKKPWTFSKIIPPRYSFQGAMADNTESKFYTMGYVVNRPTFITDNHVISIRKMIEQLWSPKFSAHIHVELEGQIFVHPLYSITHGAFRAADVYEYLESIISPINPEKPYVLSVGGFYSNRNGHSHFWNAKASGKNIWKAKFHNDHGGSIREDVGNYNLIKVEFSYRLTKYYRKVYSQDSLNFLTMDYNSYIRTLRLPIYDSFDGKILAGFAEHSGDYWSTDSNTIPYGRGRAPKYTLVRTHNAFGNPTYISQPLNIIMSSCMLPIREFGLNSWMGGGGGTHDMLRGYNIVYDHEHMLQHSVNRFVIQSVYSPDLGEEIPIPEAISYFEKTETAPWREGKEFQIHCEEPDISQGAGVSGNAYVTSLIGTRFEPMFRATWQDINGNINTTIITEVELYGINSMIPDNSPIEISDPDFSSCESL